MKTCVILLPLLLAGYSASTLAQSCATSSSIPSGHKKLGGGSATVHYDGTARVKGGQAVYVKIKNENVLGVSYILTVEEDGKPPVANCSYKAILLPKTTVILSGALFTEPPIAWKVTVAVGDESDAGVLTFEVYSTPPPESPKHFQLKFANRPLSNSID
jgi:hypothetical protein